jgi:hypothetical protein
MAKTTGTKKGTKKSGTKSTMRKPNGSRKG